MKLFSIISVTTILLLYSCNNSPASTSTVNVYDDDVLKSIIADTDSLKTFDFVTERIENIKKAMQSDQPVLLCSDSLNGHQQLAQTIALSDSIFTKNIRNPKNNIPYRTEIFGVYPARESDLSSIKNIHHLPDVYRV